MTRLFPAAFLAALSLQAAAQSIPATDYTDLWDNSWSGAPGTNPNPGCPGGESGWGVTFTQHTSNQLQAIWFTYDPRQPDGSTGSFKPYWIVMPGGTWTTPTSITGDAYVTLGTPFSQPWGFGGTKPPLPVTKVGSFTFTFSDNRTGTFTYNVVPPGGLASTDPAFALPPMSGTKPICRNSFP